MIWGVPPFKETSKSSLGIQIPRWLVLPRTEPPPGTLHRSGLRLFLWSAWEFECGHTRVHATWGQDPLRWFFGTEKPKKFPRMGTWQSWQGGQGNFHIFFGGYQGSCKFQRKFEGIFRKMRGKLFGLVSCHMTPCLDQVIGGHQLRMMKTKNHQWWIEQMTRNVCSYSTVGLCWINSSTIWQIWRKAISKSPRIEASVLVSGYVMFDWLPLLVEKVASKSTLLGYWKIPGCWVTPRKEGSNPPIPMCFFLVVGGSLQEASTCFSDPHF